MKITIGEVLDKINTMRGIVRSIENGASVDLRLDEIANFLDEYILVLSNIKVDF